MHVSRAPVILAQDSIPQVLEDVINGNQVTEKFWVSWNGNECQFEVCVANNQLEVRSLGELYIAGPNSTCEPSKVCLIPLENTHGNHTIPIRFPFIDVSDPSTSYVYRLWFSTANFDELSQWYDCQTNNITCLDCSKDKLLFGDSNGGLYLVSILENGSLRQKFAGHLACTSKCLIFPSGEVAVSFGSDFQVKIWGLATSHCVRSLPHQSQIVDLAIVGRGRNLLTVAEDNVVRLWECGTGSIVHELPIKGSVSAITVLGNKTASSEDDSAMQSELEFELANKVLAVATASEILLIDLVTKQVLKSIQTPKTTCLTDWNGTLVSGNTSGEIHCWDPATGDLKQSSLALEGGEHGIIQLSSHRNKLSILTTTQALALTVGELAHSYLVTDASVPLTAVCTTTASIYIGGKSGYLRQYVH